MSSNTALQEKTVKVLATAQVLNGVGVAGTVAAGSLLVASITNSETLAGLAQTSSVLGAAALALPLARLTSRGGRRLALSVGLIAGVFGSLLAIFGGSRENIYLMLTGTFLVGAALLLVIKQDLPQLILLQMKNEPSNSHLWSGDQLLALLLDQI